MAKKKAPKPAHELSKRQLSQWQQQRLRARQILIAGLCIIVIAVGVVAGGWYTSQYRPLHEVVIQVNSTSFSMSYFIKMFKYYGQGLDPQYLPYIAYDVAQGIQQNELIVQGAEKLGFTVSNAEIEKERKSSTPVPSKDLRLLIEAQLVAKKLGDEYFDKQLPDTIEQRLIAAMMLESRDQANEIFDRVNQGESFSELAGKLSLNSYTASKKGDLDWRPKDALPLMLGTSAVADYAFSANAGELSQPLYDPDATKSVGYRLIKIVERNDDIKQVHIQAMLLSNEAEAKRIRAQLENGEDFATLAPTYSQYSGVSENKGDLGWVNIDTMSTAVNDYVFKSGAAAGSLSEPIKDAQVTTKSGYWLVKVADIDSGKKLEGENRELLKGNLFNEWLNGEWNNPSNIILNYLDEAKIAWAVEKASK